MTEKERQIREILGDDFPLLPEILNLLEPSIEIGKYYEYINNCENMYFVFKITEIKKITGTTSYWGYGLDFINGEAVFEDHCGWVGCEHVDYVKEITQEEFLEHIANYAVNVLGFKEGVKYICTGGEEGIARHKPVQFSILESLHCGHGQGLIFKDGKFADIIEQPKEAGVTTWKPTNNLRYIKYSITNNLQQKWVETNTGVEEWREVEIV